MPEDNAQEAEVIIDLDDISEESGDKPVVEVAEEDPSPEPKTEAPKQGKRAEKRIRSLVQSNKELRQALDISQKREQDAAQKVKEAEVQVGAYADHSIAEAEQRVEAELERARADLKRGHSEEYPNVDLITDAQERLAAAKAQELAIKSYKQQTAATETISPEPKEPTPKTKSPAQPVSPRMKQWLEENPWFSKDRLKHNLALAVHDSMVNVEGFDPAGDEDAYYEELDKRLTELPQFADKTEKPKPRQVTAGASRTPAASRNRVTLSPSEVAMAKRQGVSLKDYAREKAKIQAQEGG